MPLRVSIIILNWNNWQATIEAIESAHRSNFEDYDVIVVDNASTDESVEKIKEYSAGNIGLTSKYITMNPLNKPLHTFELSEEDARRGKFNMALYKKIDPDRRLILIRNRKNYGFGGGNNVGIKFALTVLKPDYILLLNNDALVTPETLSRLVESAETLKAGVVTPKILWARNPQLIDSAGGEYSKNGYSFDRGKFRPSREFNNREEVSTVCAACSLYSSRTLEKAGLFNDRLFFLYYEDTDLASRIRWAGEKLIYEPSAVAYHYGGKSTKGLEISDLAVSHSLKGHLLCAIINLPKKYAPLYVLGNIVYALYNFILRRKIKAVAEGYLMLLSALPRAIRERKHIQRKISEEEFSRLLTLKWRAF
ncbi:glycosyltransferase family 2 protein [Thermococcus sp.]|uniref:glycosyltransferase family 2 protein n=1 Tax=Thermococcus sp. TaxID=35749 RepID=UPI00262ACD11|nr:glycosyltransferase family 2 protein [Thermococcus sp.]